MENRSAQLLRATAQFLAAEPLEDRELREPALGLARSLGYLDLTKSDRAAAVMLLRTGARLERVFQLQAPDAPGLIVFGGEADPDAVGLGKLGQGVASLAGCGLSLRDALEPCIGEGVEYLSQLEFGNEHLVEGAACRLDHGHDDQNLARLLARLFLDRDVTTADLDWCHGHRLADGASILVPADLVLRRAEERCRGRPLVPLGLGTAAGPTLDAAILAGLLELIERDAAALWWLAECKGKTISTELLAHSKASSLLNNLRSGQSGRRTWLMDISTDLQIPVIAAISVNENGLGFACGLAARLDTAEAIRDAVLELCQMELAHHIVEMKRRERGDEALNEADRRHLRRGRSIDANQCPNLFPSGVANLGSEGLATDTESQMSKVMEQLKHADIDAFYVDLTRSVFAVPAAWVCAPGLQPLPGNFSTPRLTSALEKSGKALLKGAIPLI